MIWLGDIVYQLNRIESKIDAITRKEKAMALSLDALTAEASRQTTVDASIMALLDSVVAALKAIPPSNDAATQAAIDQVTALIKSNDDAIVAKTLENTPAAS